MIYFDNAATTYPKPEEVYKALDEANRSLAFNSGRGSYKKAKIASQIIDDTRAEIASFVDVPGNNVVFSASATEALNSIIFGLDWAEGDNVYVSPFEHNSIIRPLEEIRRRYGVNIITIPFEKTTWKLSEDISDMFLLNSPKYIFCSSKSNVTGYRLPTEEIFKLGKKYKSVNILDASQSFGVDRTIKKENTDFIVFAGHKSLYATFGVAGFIKIYQPQLKAWIFGGTGSESMKLEMPEEEPMKYEAGSRNIVSIYGLNKSIKWLKKTDVDKKEKMLFSYFCDKIKEIDKVITYLPRDNSLCSSIISINIEGYQPEQVGEILEMDYNICVRTGYHCAPLIHDFIGSKDYYGTVRISMSYFNTYEEIDRLIDALKTF